MTHTPHTHTHKKLHKRITELQSLKDAEDRQQTQTELRKLQIENPVLQKLKQPFSQKVCIPRLSVRRMR